MTAFDRLATVVARLRGEGGCDWDRAQTPESMRPHVLEEAHEVVHAIDVGDASSVREEIGDLTFLLSLIARMYEEDGAFSIDDALNGVSDKMERRHPHVFGDAEERPAWEAIKAQERANQPTPSSALDGLPKAMPALLRAQRVTSRASKVGFDWPDVSGVRAKVDEELAELDEALASGDAAHAAEELGDLLFTLVNLARFLSVDAETTLRQATAKFERRFRSVEDLALADGASVLTSDLDTLEGYWQRSKERDA